jgi:hypothetical protein
LNVDLLAAGGGRDRFDCVLAALGNIEFANTPAHNIRG